MKIFLTGPASTPYAREFISNAAKTLREKGHAVFVPHEGGWEAPPEPFQVDHFHFAAACEAAEGADLLIAILDGFIVDDSVSVQIGMFFAFNKSSGQDRRMLGILHDTRVAGWGWDGEDRALTPQVRECFHTYGKVYPNFKKVLAALEREE